MKRMELIREFRAAMKSTDRLGDVVVLKAELSGRSGCRPEVEATLGEVRGYHPRLDLDALAALPEGAFGREYVRFLRHNKLFPITLSGTLPAEMVARNAFTVRYGIIHDMVHVLLGFDASWPGEVGVWAFIGGQDYGPTFNFAARMALLAAPFRCPLRLGEAWRAYVKGREMGRRARPVVAVRLEDLLDRPLEEVRAQLGIEGAARGYLPAPG